MPLVGFEPTVSVGERPQTYALNRAATGTGLAPLTFPHLPKKNIRTRLHIQSVPGGNVNSLGRHSIGHSKQKIVYVHVCYSERFPRYSYFTVQEFGFGAQCCSALPPYCATVRSM